MINPLIPRNLNHILEIKQVESQLEPLEEKKEDGEESSSYFFDQHQSLKKPANQAISSFLKLNYSTSNSEQVDLSKEEQLEVKSELKHFAWDYTTREAFEEFIHQNPDIEILDLSFASSDEVKKGLFDLSGLSNLKQIKQINLKPYDFWWVAEEIKDNRTKSFLTLPYLPSLETVNLSLNSSPLIKSIHTVGLLEKILDHLSIQTPHLKKLILDYSSFWDSTNNENKEQLNLEGLKNLKNLEELHLGYGDLILYSTQSFKSLQEIPNLRVLDLQYTKINNHMLLRNWIELYKPLFSHSSLEYLNLTQFLPPGFQLSIFENEQGFPELKKLYLGENELEGSLVPSLFPNLEILNLNGANLTKMSLEEFFKFSKLEELHLSKTVLSKENREQLSSIILPHLKVLDLSSSSLHGLFKQIFSPNLINLNLKNSNITNGDVKNLTGMPGLEQLDLSHTKISSSSIKSLSQLENLKVLNLSQNDLWGADFSALASLEKLENLNLSNCKISVEDFSKLSHLSNLKTLNISNLNNQSITRELIENLKKQLPNVDIIG